MGHFGMSYFTKEEMACSCCGASYMDTEFMEVLNAIRHECSWPFIISSAYRCPEHPAERLKTATGTHTYGVAADILCFGEKALQLITVAQSYGVNRIGISQKGNVGSRFIHLDIGDRAHHFPAPAIFTY